MYSFCICDDLLISCHINQLWTASLLLNRPYLTDSNGVVQHRLGVSGVVAAWELGVAEVGLQQQVRLRVGAVVGVGVDLQRELLSQLAVQLVLVVSDGQLSVLLRILGGRDQK